MANQTRDDMQYDNSGGPAQRQGTDVKSGLHGGSVRRDEVGRDEFFGRGEAARNDVDDRADTAGRHYGRTGHESPGRGYGEGPLQARGRSAPGYGDRETRNSEWDEFQRGETRGFAHGESTPRETWSNRGESPWAGRDARDVMAREEYGRPDEGERGAYGNVGLRGREPAPSQQQRAGRWRRTAVRARDVMTRNPRTVSPTDSVQQVAQIMQSEDCGIVPVVEADGRLAGVVTDRDIAVRLVARGGEVNSATARDVMSDDVECVTEQDSLRDVLHVMSEHQVRRVPVVAKGDRLCGIIAMADIAREADVDQDLQRVFDDISAERTFWSRLR